MPRRPVKSKAPAREFDYPRWLILVAKGDRLDVVAAHHNKIDAQLVYGLLNRLASAGVSVHLIEVPQKSGYVESDDPITVDRNTAPDMGQVQKVALEAAGLMPAADVKPAVTEFRELSGRTGRDDEAFS